MTYCRVAIDFLRRATGGSNPAVLRSNDGAAPLESSVGLGYSRHNDRFGVLGGHVTGRLEPLHGRGHGITPDSADGNPTASVGRGAGQEASSRDWMAESTNGTGSFTLARQERTCGVHAR